MKKLCFLLVALLGIFSIGFGQAKKGLQTITIQTPTVQCESCKKRVESYMIREEGVHKVVLDHKKKVAKVTYYAERTHPNYIRTAIANLGYDADGETANPESYKKLPKCCKKPEDGGGM